MKKFILLPLLLCLMGVAVGDSAKKGLSDSTVGGTKRGSSGISFPSSGLVAYWKINDTLTDSVGGHDATSATPDYLPAKRLDGMRITGYQSPSIMYSSGADTWANLPFAVSWMQWIYPTIDSNNEGFAAKSSFANAAGDWDLGFVTGGANDVLVVRINGGALTVTAPSAIAINQWHLVGWTYDGSFVRLWIDDVNVISAAFVAPIGNSATYLGIGMYYSTSYGMTGLTDECGLWSRALPQADIDKLWNGGLGSFLP
jgi:hypothetical protein